MGGGLVFGSVVDRASFLDVADTSFSLPVRWVGVSFLVSEAVAAIDLLAVASYLSLAAMKIPSFSMTALVNASVCDGVVFGGSATTTTIAWLGSILDSGGYCGTVSGGLSCRHRYCVKVKLHNLFMRGMNQSI